MLNLLNLNKMDIEQILTGGVVFKKASAGNGQKELTEVITGLRKDLDAEQVTYFICDEPRQDGHTDLLFDIDGTANDELMAQVNAFFLAHVK